MYANDILKYLDFEIYEYYWFANDTTKRGQSFEVGIEHFCMYHAEGHDAQKPVVEENERNPNRYLWTAKEIQMQYIKCSSAQSL